MATTRIANAHWEGSLIEGAGKVSLDSSGLGEFDVTWASRAEDPAGRTSPEELIAAALSSCFNMAFSGRLNSAGSPPQALDTRAEVDFVPGQGITEIRLTVRGQVDGLDNDTFVEIAEDAKENCPVSQALKGTTITIAASLA
jgi:osmotically inducible protein OsmC